MRPSIEITPVKFFVAVLFSDEVKLSEARKKLVQAFGEIDYESEKFPFNETDYYLDEMGDEIKRVFWSFHTLRTPDFLVYMKEVCYGVEVELGIKDGGKIKRKVNIDPGYIDLYKVVLASFKGGGIKIYLGKRVWVDPILIYESGKFRPLLRTFPDFRSGKYDHVLHTMRELYKESLRKL